MKITKMNGLGSFGIYVDDFDHKSPEAWKELERLSLKYLVVVVRNKGVHAWEDITTNIHIMIRTRFSTKAHLVEKYGKDWKNREVFDDVDRYSDEFYSTLGAEGKKWGGAWSRITGELDQKGNPTGQFIDTELLWHSNGSGVKTLAPLVGLYGVRNMVGSSTGFAVTADWLDQQTESFRSELREMMTIHTWKPEALEPTGHPLGAATMRYAFTEPKPSEMPLVMTSPGGIEGIHLGLNTLSAIKGMNQKDSDALIQKLTTELLDPKWTLDVWWENDCGDLYLFENSITMHNRIFRPGIDIKEALEKRLGHRIAGDYASKIDWEPSKLEPWASERKAAWPLHDLFGQVSELRALRAIDALKETPEEKKAWWLYVCKNRPDIAKRLRWTEAMIEEKISQFY